MHTTVYWSVLNCSNVLLLEMKSDSLQYLAVLSFNRISISVVQQIDFHQIGSWNYPLIDYPRGPLIKYKEDTISYLLSCTLLRTTKVGKRSPLIYLCPRQLMDLDVSNIDYCTRYITSRGLYTFYPIFHYCLYCSAASITNNICTKQGNFSILPLKSAVYSQERFQIKSRL